MHSPTSSSDPCCDSRPRMALFQLSSGAVGSVFTGEDWRNKEQH